MVTRETTASQRDAQRPDLLGLRQTSLGTGMLRYTCFHDQRIPPTPFHEKLICPEF